jgi:hypothetical protein
MFNGFSIPIQSLYFRDYTFPLGISITFFNSPIKKNEILTL